MKREEAKASPGYTIRLDTICSGFLSGQRLCHTDPRAGIVKGEKPSIVWTLSPLDLSGSDVFYAITGMSSEDGGRTWSPPAEQLPLGRRALHDGLVEAICGFTPAWHEASGKLLGTGHTVTYTQQHWVTHSDGLFLVYTRETEDNAHVFRHRAPLFIAEVDPERLCLIRSSERVLVPERGARLCNFGVVNVNERETWVTVAEWMQNGGVSGKEMRRRLLLTHTPEELALFESAPHMSGLVALWGADNSVYAARIVWDVPNRYS